MLDRLKQVVRTHPYFDNGDKRMSFLSNISLDELQYIKQTLGKTPQAFHSEERKLLFDSILDELKNSIPNTLNIGDPTLPVNPENIVAGDFVIYEQGEPPIKYLCLVKKVNNISGKAYIEWLYSQWFGLEKEFFSKSIRELVVFARAGTTTISTLLPIAESLGKLVD